MSSYTWQSFVVDCMLQKKHICRSTEDSQTRFIGLGRADLGCVVRVTKDNGELFIAKVFLAAN